MWNRLIRKIPQILPKQTSVIAASTAASVMAVKATRSDDDDNKKAYRHDPFKVNYKNDNDDLMTWISSTIATMTAPKAVHCSSSSSATTVTDNGPWPIQISDSYHYELVQLPNHLTGETSHVIFGQLLKKNLVERYAVYNRVNTANTGNNNNIVFENHDEQTGEELILADVQLGNSLDGHKGVVHGGILALLFDDTMGFAYHAAGISMAYTANLNVNYRIPVPAQTHVVMRVRQTRRQGRKVYFQAQLTNADGTILYADATSLYIIPKNYDPQVVVVVTDVPKPQEQEKKEVHC